MTVSVTSKQAYVSIKPMLNKNESIVYTAIERLQPCTNEQIAQFLGWPIQSVTGRTNGLVAKNMATMLDTNGKTTTGRSAKRWCVMSTSDYKGKELHQTQAQSWLND